MKERVVTVLDRECVSVCMNACDGKVVVSLRHCFCQSKISHVCVDFLLVMGWRCKLRTMEKEVIQLLVKYLLQLSVE